MNLCDDDVERLLFAVNDAITLRQRVRLPVPAWMLPLARRFDTASLTSGMSASGHQFEGDESESESERLISAAEAAPILSLSVRQVRRLAADLDGVKVGERGWAFSLSTVIQYAEGRTDGRVGRGIRAAPPVAER